VAAEEIGRALHVARAGYGEIVQNGEVVRVERDWTAGEMFSLAGDGARARRLRPGRDR
jgi:hypothetical protein